MSPTCAALQRRDPGIVERFFWIPPLARRAGGMTEKAAPSGCRGMAGFLAQRQAQAR